MQTKTEPEEWVLDISDDPAPPCYCPVRGEAIVYSKAVIAKDCPGRLVGVVSLRGQEHVDRYLLEHPSLIAAFSPSPD